MVFLKAFDDRSYKFLIKPPPTSWMIKKAIGKEKLSGHRSNNSGKLSLRSLYEIAKIKKELDYDLVNVDLESICRTIAAQCGSMNVTIVPEHDAPTQIIKPILKI